MKQTLLLFVLTSAFLAGCASTHKLTQPKGQWQPINQAGFVPANAEIFQKTAVQQTSTETTTNQAEVSEFGQSQQTKAKE